MQQQRQRITQSHSFNAKKRWQQTKGFHFDLKAPGSIILDNPVCGDGKKKKKQPEPNVEFGTFIGDRLITLILDIKAANEANHSEPWRKRHARHKGQKKAIFVALLDCKEIVKMPCVLKFTRYAPKMLDAHDNLPMSFKWQADEVCAQVTGELRPGLADSNKGFTFQYDQVKSKKYYVKIEISW